MSTKITKQRTVFTYEKLNINKGGVTPPADAVLASTIETGSVQSESTSSAVIDSIKQSNLKLETLAGNIEKSQQPSATSFPTQNLTDAITPMESLAQTISRPYNALLHPWLKRNDAVLVTGLGAVSDFLIKLYDSFYSRNTFFGMPCDKGFPSINYQRYCFPQDEGFWNSFQDKVNAEANGKYTFSLEKKGAMNLPWLQIGQFSHCTQRIIIMDGLCWQTDDDLKALREMIRELKIQNITLIAGFNRSSRALEKDCCWDSVIKISKPLLNSPAKWEMMPIRFLKVTRPTLLKETWLMALTDIGSRVPCIFFLPRETKFDQYRDFISNLMSQRFTANEIRDKLKKEFGVEISLPMLAKLKRQWGLRTYKQERHKRKTYTKRQP